MRKIGLFLFVFCFLFALPQAFAADGSALDIKLQLGSETVSINGEESQVEAPYLENETTLVPLRVITTAFGAALDWDAETQGITLTYGEQIIKMAIGSDKAEVDGEAMKLPAAPGLKNGTTMVPIRFISETFGAEVSFDPETSGITITGTKQEGAAQDGSGINVDAGKTRIGNSYYGWSMKYPSGLVKDYQSFREEYVSFMDAKEEYELSVLVEEEQDTLSKDGLLKRLASDSDSTVIDKQTVADNGVTYARVVTKDDESYTEARSYQKADRIYTLYFTADSADYKHVEKYKTYKALLDSFQIAFDKQDDTIKDLSTVKDGTREYTGSENGLKLRIPAEWYSSQSGEWMTFYKDGGSESVVIRLSSKVEGDTLDKWVRREQDYLLSEFAPAYFKLEPKQDLKLSGIDAQRLKYAVKSGTNWSTTYGFYLFEGDFKYEIDVLFSESKDKPELVDQIVQSVDFAEVPELGTIQDDRDFVDKSRTETASFNSMKFSLQIPHYWDRSSDDTGEEVNYNFNAGSFSVTTVEGVGMEQAKRAVDNGMKQNEENLVDFKMITTTSETVGGVTATKYVYSAAIPNAFEFQASVYLLEKNGKIYIINATLRKETATDVNVKMLAAVIQSFQFIE